MNNIEKIFKENGTNFRNFSKEYSNYLKFLLDNLDHNSLNKCVIELEKARENNNTIFIIGNGGSASTASHVGNDFGLAVIKKTKKLHYFIIING